MSYCIRKLLLDGNISIQEAMVLSAATDNMTTMLAVGDHDSDELRRRYGTIVCDYLVQN